MTVVLGSRPLLKHRNFIEVPTNFFPQSGSACIKPHPNYRTDLLILTQVVRNDLKDGDSAMSTVLPLLPPRLS